MTLKTYIILAVVAFLIAAYCLLVFPEEMLGWSVFTIAGSDFGSGSI